MSLTRGEIGFDVDQRRLEGSRSRDNGGCDIRQHVDVGAVYNSPRELFSGTSVAPTNARWICSVRACLCSSVSLGSLYASLTAPKASTSQPA